MIPNSLTLKMATVRFVETTRHCTRDGVQPKAMGDLLDGLFSSVIAWFSS
jgi:hypothetical protein